MDRVILSLGYNREGLSQKQIDAAVNVFADAQKKAGVSAGTYTPIIANSNGQLFIIEAQYGNDGETETINIKHVAPIAKRVVERKYRKELLVDVTTEEQKAEAEAKAKAKAAKKPAAKKPESKKAKK